MSKSNSSNISVVGLLGIVFIVLKLTHVIDWSWWLVTLPFWAPLSLYLIGALFILIFALIFNND